MAIRNWLCFLWSKPGSTWSNSWLAEDELFPIVTSDLATEVVFRQGCGLVQGRKKVWGSIPPEIQHRYQQNYGLEEVSMLNFGGVYFHDKLIWNPKKDLYFKRKCHPPTIDSQGMSLVFQSSTHIFFTNGWISKSDEIFQTIFFTFKI